MTQGSPSLLRDSVMDDGLSDDCQKNRFSLAPPRRCELWLIKRLSLDGDCTKLYQLFVVLKIGIHVWQTIGSEMHATLIEWESNCMLIATMNLHPGRLRTSELLCAHQLL